MKTSSDYPPPSRSAIRVNQKLKDYIETNIFPQYSLNDSGHQIGHIEYVIRRSLDFAATVPNINFDMVYAVAAYHDIGHHIDAKHHERVSSQIFKTDNRIKEFFAPQELLTIAEAIEDHRSSSDHPPRSVYGKIVTAADKIISIEAILRRTYAYRLCNFHATSLDNIIEESRQHLINKYGRTGYALNENYFPDPEFKRAVDELQRIIYDQAAFRRQYLTANNLQINN